MSDQPQNLSAQQLKEDLLQYNKKQRNIIFGASMVCGLTAVTSAVIHPEMLDPTTPIAHEFNISGADGVIVGMFVIMLAKSLKLSVKNPKVEQLSKKVGDIVQNHGSNFSKEIFDDLKEKSNLFQDDARKNWLKSRNALTIGLGGAILASALTVGATVVSPAATVVVAASLGIGVLGIAKMSKVSNTAKRLEFIANDMVNLAEAVETTEIKRKNKLKAT